MVKGLAPGGATAIDVGAASDGGETDTPASEDESTKPGEVRGGQKSSREPGNVPTATRGLGDVQVDEEEATPSESVHGHTNGGTRGGDASR